MKKRADEFLFLSGELYEQNKRKWKSLVEVFDEDIYNDSIVKTYEAILKGEDTEGDVIAYWFKVFKNNLKRNKGYIKNQDKDEINEKVKEKEYDEKQINLYYYTVRDILIKVRSKFDRKTFEVFRMYLLCNMSYDELDRITGVDSKERIMRVRQWLNVK